MEYFISCGETALAGAHVCRTTSCILVPESPLFLAPLTLVPRSFSMVI